MLLEGTESHPNIRSDPAPWKKLNATVLCSNFFSNYSGIFLILPSSESLRFDLSFLIEVLHSSKTTVLCCRILTFWSNLALNIVSTALPPLPSLPSLPLLYPLCLKPFWIWNFKKRPGKSGSARLPRGMKLGNSTGQWLGTFREVLHLVLPISCVYKELRYRE